LTGEKLLAEVFNVLNNQRYWKNYPAKNRNFINAFAVVYDQILFKGAKLKDLQREGYTGHLEEVCFNTTEFYRGLLFRQNVRMKPGAGGHYIFGNFSIHIDEPAAMELRMGDVLAASSCFPAGFEPILFPADFVNKNLSHAQLLQSTRILLQELKREEIDRLYASHEVKDILEQLGPQPEPAQLQQELHDLGIHKTLNIGFMDGGISDNQGVESIMKANRKRYEQDSPYKPFDFMLINDVSSHYMEPWQPPKISRKTSINISRIFTLAALSIIISLAFVAYALYHKTFSGIVIATLSGAFIAIGLAVIFGLLAFRAYLIHENKRHNGLELYKSFSHPIVQSLFKYFGQTPVHVLWGMIKARFQSLLVLNNDAVLKRVRYLLYEIFLEDNKRTFRVKTNHVFDLSFSNDLNRKRNDNDIDPPGRELQKIAQYAFEMGTTLWFDRSQGAGQQQAALIACGQFTTCYNLLLYIRRMKKSNILQTFSPETQQNLNGLEKHLEKEYARFAEDPFWLYNELGQTFPIPDFKPLSSAQYAFPKDFEGLR
ncbi:MAG: hypothetical protein INR69_21235, partial [Mucilaginibacter polytrichastri]|nr:hypothetical protein [Mucilaginibacter polytrichastri]